MKASSPWIPEGLRVYAIGDIHGRADLLRRLHEAICLDAAGATPGTRFLAIYLGDYVDRGLHSREVINLLVEKPLPGFHSIYLKGNHEELFLRFLEGVECGSTWFRLEGNTTVLSYCVRIPQSPSKSLDFGGIRDHLRKSVPEDHIRFLLRLNLMAEAGDYFFVHAGIRPGIPLDKQSPADLLWIRDEFLNSRMNHPKVIVHGHSVTDEVQIRENRIGIDTGAYMTNRLTCLVLEGPTKRLLFTRRCQSHLARIKSEAPGGFAVTNCIQTAFNFPPVKCRRIEASFEGGDITSDGGVMVLRQVDRPSKPQSSPKRSA